MLAWLGLSFYVVGVGQDEHFKSVDGSKGAVVGHEPGGTGTERGGDLEGVDSAEAMTCPKLGMCGWCRDIDQGQVGQA